MLTTRYANARQLASWVLRLGEHARVLEPAALCDQVAESVELLADRHEGEFELAPEGLLPAARWARPTGPPTAWLLRPTAARSPIPAGRARSAPSASRAWSRWPPC